MIFLSEAMGYQFFTSFRRPRVQSSGRASASHAEGPALIPGRVIPKTLKMEPTAVVRDAPNKQWSKGKQASEPKLEKAAVGST